MKLKGSFISNILEKDGKHLGAQTGRYRIPKGDSICRQRWEASSKSQNLENQTMIVLDQFGKNGHRKIIKVRLKNAWQASFTSQHLEIKQ